MPRSATRSLAIAVVMAVAVGLTAPLATARASHARGGGAKCPLGALERARDKPVEITFWHAMTRVNEETLVRLTDQFNASQDDVEVKLVNQTSYEDTFEKFKAGLATGDLPDIVQLAEVTLQQVIDTQAVLPAQACVDADDYDLSDHLPRVVNYYTVEDTLWAMPFNVSGPLLYYDKAAFRRAGLDPEQPPTTLREVRDAAEAVKASGYPYGFALKIDAFMFEQLMAKAGDAYVNNKNGRAGRATEVVFDNKSGQQIFSWMAGMVNDGLAITNPREGQGQINNFLAVGNKQAAMTFDTTAAQGIILQVLGTGQFADVEPGVAPMPGGSGGGVLVGGAALFLSSKSNPQKRAAAWEYAKFINEPEQVAELSAATGYVPTREAAVELPVIQQRWAEQPGFRLAYEQLLAGKNNTATAGPVIGDYYGVRGAVEEAMERMFTQGKKPKPAIEDLKEESDEVIQEYNERLGV